MIVMLIALFLGVLCSCGKKEQDLSGIISVPGDFLEAVKNLDADAAAVCAPGFDASEWDELDEARAGIMRLVMENAEITEMGTPVIYGESGSADMEVAFSYVSLRDIVDSLKMYRVTEDQIRDCIKEQDDRSEKTINLEFEYSEDDGCWVLTKSSARKICKLFSFDTVRTLSIVDLTEEEAEDVLMSYLEGIAECRDAKTFPEELDLSSYRFYDDSLHGGEGTRTEDAVARFAAAYMGYVLSHEPEVRTNWDYSVYLYGEAPSENDLMNALSSDEYQIENYAILLKYLYLGMDLEELMDAQTALIYNTLAEAIPQCGSEEYILYAVVSPYKDAEEECTLLSELINKPYSVDNSIEYTEEQYYYLLNAAIEYLHDNGEADDEQYEMMLENRPDAYEGFTTDVSVSVSGHPNQAVGTFDYVPSWCDDYSIIYGQSYTDEQGFSMFYSRQPGWLHTAGYCIDEEGIRIANYFDRIFYPGNQVIVDWWLDDELIVDTQIITVDTFTNEIEVFLPVGELPENCYYEMRLWETDHNHVISYVTLTR
ncbi:MAG: hypothetical protein K6F65_01515 [Lachnospiraceae bacterium]|nr:hypothetical protein [Lachnospiraceae bacterium]